MSFHLCSLYYTLHRLMRYHRCITLIPMFHLVAQQAVSQFRCVLLLLAVDLLQHDKC